MASNVQICNRALQKLGAKRIVSLDQDSKNARACNTAFESVRDSEYRDHTWSFAVKRAQLAADSTAPLFNRTQSYTLPSDFIRLLPTDPEWNTNSVDWQIEGRAIITNDSAPLNIRYISRVTDPNQMDALFQEALAARLAVELCEELTQSNTKREQLQAEYQYWVREAKKVNAIERVAQKPPEDPWVTVRE